MYMHFEVENFLEPMIIPLTGGKEFNITKPLWDEHFQPDLDVEYGFEEENRILYRVWNSTVYLTSHIFWEEFPQDMLNKILVDVPKSFFIVDLGLLDELMHRPYWITLDESWIFEDEAIKAQRISEAISLGVSIITVAVVLSTTMANRLNEKKVYDRINLVRADLLKNPELGKKIRDKFAVPVLIFALIISLIGLALAFIEIILTDNI